MSWYQNYPAKGKKVSSARQQALYNTMVYDLEFIDQNIRDITSFFSDGMVIGCVAEITGNGFKLNEGVVSYKGKIVPVTGEYDIAVADGQYICYENEIKVTDEPAGTVIAKLDGTTFDYSVREYNAPSLYPKFAIVNTMKDIDSVQADYVFIRSSSDLYVRMEQTAPDLNTIATRQRMVFHEDEEMPLVSTRIYKTEDYKLTTLGGLAVINSPQPFRLRLIVNGVTIGEVAFSSTAESNYRSCRIVAPVELKNGYNRLTLSYVPEQKVDVEVKSSAILGG